jgi:hypothetical protein
MNAPALERYVDPAEEDPRGGYGLAEAHPPNPPIEIHLPKTENTFELEARRAGKGGDSPAASAVGVSCFPWYRESLGAWLWLTALIFAMGLLVSGLASAIRPL